jgi:membrane protein required for colicin V production
VGDLLTVDAVAAALLGLALLRGLWIGAVREAFSLAGLAAAAWAVRAWRLPAAAWLAAHAPFEMTGLAARVLAAIGVGAGTLIAVALLGRLVYRGVREAGLGFADRLLGAALGLLEGALVVGVLVLGLSTLIGRDDAALAGTRSLAAFEWAEAALGFERPAATDRSSHPARE